MSTRKPHPRWRDCTYGADLDLGPGVVLCVYSHDIDAFAWSVTINGDEWLDGKRLSDDLVSAKLDAEDALAADLDKLRSALSEGAANG